MHVIGEWRGSVAAAVVAVIRASREDDSGSSGHSTRRAGYVFVFRPGRNLARAASLPLPGRLSRPRLFGGRRLWMGLAMGHGLVFSIFMLCKMTGSQVRRSRRALRAGCCAHDLPSRLACSGIGTSAAARARARVLPPPLALPARRLSYPPSPRPRQVVFGVSMVLMAAPIFTSSYEIPAPRLLRIRGAARRLLAVGRLLPLVARDIGCGAVHHHGGVPAAAERPRRRLMVLLLVPLLRGEDDPSPLSRPRAVAMLGVCLACVLSIQVRGGPSSPSSLEPRHSLTPRLRLSRSSARVTPTTRRPPPPPLEEEGARADRIAPRVGGSLAAKEAEAGDVLPTPSAPDERLATLGSRMDSARAACVCGRAGHTVLRSNWNCHFRTRGPDRPQLAVAVRIDWRRRRRGAMQNHGCAAPASPSPPPLPRLMLSSPLDITVRVRFLLKLYVRKSVSLCVRRDPCRERSSLKQDFR